MIYKIYIYIYIYILDMWGYKEYVVMMESQN